MISADRRRRLVVSGSSTLAGAIFVAATLVGIGLIAGHWVLVVYSLSFWHYLIYALAFVCRAIPLRLFKRDAVLMKSVSLLAFGSVYLSLTPDLLSLLVVAAGLLLNLSAARQLGSDRTYYGYELAGLPAKRITAFPYSVLAHPMLIGNSLAFAGTLLNAEFRADWWPLAVVHILLNLAILVMEVRAQPRHPIRPAVLGRQSWPAIWPSAAGLTLFGALLASVGGGWLAVSGVVLAMLGYSAALFEYYAWNGRMGESNT